MPGTKDKIDEVKKDRAPAFMENSLVDIDKHQHKKKFTSKSKPSLCKITREHTQNKQYIQLTQT